MRKNLEGHEFKTVIGHWKPFTYDIEPIREDGSLVTSASGYVMDIGAGDDVAYKPGCRRWQHKDCPILACCTKVRQRRFKHDR